MSFEKYFLRITIFPMIDFDLEQNIFLTFFKKLQFCNVVTLVILHKEI
jgi:hypothetical protein